MDTALVQPAGPVRATVQVPGSRSLTNRALVCAALASGRSELRNWGDCDDTRVMIGGLEQLGVRLAVGGDAVAVDGGGRLAAPAAPIDVMASGTTMRFLTAVAALAEGETTLDGTARMRQRPIGDLAEALNRLGAHVTTDGGTPPVQVKGRALAGGPVSVDATTSSQFLSAVLLVAPQADVPVTISTEGIVSRPFVDMTIRVMAEFGIDVDEGPAGVFRIQSGPYAAASLDIEPDAMSAGYFLAAAAITGGEVAVPGLGTGSLQGDAGFAHVLGRMGCAVTQAAGATTVSGPERLHGIDADMNAMPDSALTLAVAAAFAGSPTRIRNVANLAVKESDRLTALATELRKLGAAVETHGDGLTITPPDHPRPARIATYDDHRMAMSFAIAGLATEGGVEIEDPDCAAKTYPAFFEDLAALTT